MSLPIGNNNFVKPFQLLGQSDQGRQWASWVDRFELYLEAVNITAPQRKRALLLTSAGEDIYELFKELPEPADGTTRDVFETTKYKLSTYFASKLNIEFELYTFRQASQSSDETLDQYYTRLSKLAQTCDFHDIQREVKSQLIQHMTSGRLRRYALRHPTATLTDILTEGRAYELTEQRASAIEEQPEQYKPTEAVNAIKNYAKKNNSRRQKHFHKTGSDQNDNGPTQPRKCYNCGRDWPHEGGRGACPAKGKICSNCGKANHFAKVCRSEAEPDYNNAGPSCNTDTGKRKSFVHATTDKPKAPPNTLCHTDDSSDESTYQLRVSNAKANSTSEIREINSCSDHSSNLARPNKSAPVTASIMVNNSLVKFMVDTGTSVTIISTDTMNKIGIEHKIQPTDTNIFPYNSNSGLVVQGKFNATLQFKDKVIESEIFVIQGKSESLLSCSDSVNLGLIKITCSVSDNPTVDSVDYTEKFSSLFSGIGKLNNYQVHIHVDETVPPVAQRHRRIPFNVRKMVESEIKRLEDADIIEIVEGPTPWVSPVVVVPKPHSPDSVRLCIDMRHANKAIKRVRHVTPTIEDIVTSLNGAAYFSKLDLNDGYYQLELDLESRSITTFSTHMGLRRYKRLNFGISSASEVFQDTIRQTLGSLKGVLNVSDDILIFGKTRKEHDEALVRVLSRLEERGLTLNKKKCQFAQTELKFFGYVFTKQGLQIDPEKISAISNLEMPTNPTEVRSLLGMLNYCGRFLPDLASVTKPLRELTESKREWKWTQKHINTFNKLKSQMMSAITLAYYDADKETHLHVDAGPHGVGAILSQQNGETLDIIGYASRALTAVEERYSQIEREAVSAVYGMEHFHLYLCGSNFILHTDSKPLVSIFSNPSASPSARIERLLLRTQPYQFHTVHQVGKENPSDYLSRHPLPFSCENRRTHKVPEEYVNFLTKQSCPVSLSLDDIETETAKDEIFKLLIAALQAPLGQAYKMWMNEDLKPYSRIKDELTTSNGVVLRGTRLVIPPALHKTAVRLAHRGHRGMVKTKQLIREKLWFPNMDKLVQDAVMSCIPCQAITKPKKSRDPIRPTELPDGPWKNVVIDFDGPYPDGKYLLVLTDEYSRYPFVEIIQSTATKHVTQVLQKLFCQFGVVVQLKSDNGPPFNGTEFAEFAKQMQFKHHKVTPLWPEANGQAERSVAAIRKTVLAANLEKKDLKTELDYALMNYRATPHSTTNRSPYELMFGRKMRTTLPSTPDNLKCTVSDQDVRKSDAEQKRKAQVYADKKRHTELHVLEVGDRVLCRQQKRNKLSTLYDPDPFTVIKISGSQITAKRGQQIIIRNSSFLKKFTTQGDLWPDDQMYTPRVPAADVDDMVRPPDGAGVIPVLVPQRDGVDPDPPDGADRALPPADHRGEVPVRRNPPRIRQVPARFR